MATNKFQQLGPVSSYRSVSSGTLTLLNDNCKSNLFIFDVNRRVLIRVLKSQFKELDAPVVVFRNFKIKLKTGCKKEIGMYKDLLQNLKIYKAESLISLVQGMFDVTKACSKLTYRLVTGTTDVHTSALILDATSLMLQHSAGTYNNWTPSYFLGFLARIYSIFLRTKSVMQQESLDGMLLLASSIALPDAVFQILKRLNLLTSKKIGDHPGLFLELVQLISLYLNKLISSIGWIPDKAKELLERIFSYGAIHTLLYEIKVLYDTWSKDKRVMMKEEFRQQVKDVKIKIDNHPDTVDKIRNMLSFKQEYSNLEKLCVAAKAYEKCSRQEPVCIVLEGPPGVRKTIAMLHIIKLLGKSVYTHIIKSTDDGKDHYDGYNNEDVFVMDDVGQQGLSQWRTIINMVSSVRMPLECAAVELKDTKYFDSKIILITTNNFSDLQGLTKSDGISDIKALWRRAHVFKFEKENEVYYKRFDVIEDNWINNVPFKCNIKNAIKGSTLEISAWITAHVELLEQHYFKILEKVELTKSQVEIARDLVDAYKESYYDCESYDTATLILNNGYQYCMELIKNLFELIMDFVQHYSNLVTAGVIGLCVYGVYKGIVSLFADGEPINTNLEALNEWKSVVKNKNRTITIKQGQALYSESQWGTLIESVAKNVKIVKVLNSNGELEISHALVSGTKVILPAHVIYDSANSIIIYNSQQDFVKENRAVDMSKFQVVMEDRLNDVAILHLPMLNTTPYRNLSHLFKYKGLVAKDMYFLWSGDPVKIQGSAKALETAPKYITKYGTVYPDNVLTYEMTSKGFCGSIIADENVGILGFHVAGDGSSTGIAKLFSQSLIAKISNILNDGYDTNYDLDHINGELFSGMVRKTVKRSDGPKNSHLKKTIFSDSFEESKQPANLRALGENTVKLRAKRMHKPVVPIDPSELNFMGKFLDFILPNFGVLPEAEVIGGNENLASINKDSVSGLDFPLSKENYFDFEKNICKEGFKEELNNFRMQCQTRYPDKITQHHTLKDELRLLHKVNRPRTFGVDSLLTQFEMKRLMGDLFIKIKEERWNNGVFIGCNPYKDWPKLYEKLSVCKIHWDGDVGEWDASVSPQLQDMLNEKVINKFYGHKDDKLILERILDLSVRSWVVAGNKEYYKTHGILSGMWITNLFNSIINRCYTAGWYYRNYKSKYKKEPSVSKFLMTVVDFTQGDDKINGVKGDVDVLNARTMRDYFVSVGMSFTDGEKGEIDFDSKQLEDCVFLKRKFRFHNLLQQIVGPLSIETITNSIRWYKDDNEQEEILKDKCHVFQREMFLHDDIGMEYIEYLFKEAKEKHFSVDRLSVDYMKKTYLEDPDYWYEYVNRINNKIY
jgi:hypothetical protein